MMLLLNAATVDRAWSQSSQLADEQAQFFDQNLSEGRLGNTLSCYTSDQETVKKIQDKLLDKYRTEIATMENAEQVLAGLSDQEMGRITERWVAKYMDEMGLSRDPNCAAELDEPVPPNPEEGLYPYFLTEANFTLLNWGAQLKLSVSEKLNISYTSPEAFQVELEALIPAAEEEQDPANPVKTVAEINADKYGELISQIVDSVLKQQDYVSIGQSTLETLNNQGLPDAAASLESIVGNIIPENKFEQTIANILFDTYTTKVEGAQDKVDEGKVWRAFGLVKSSSLKTAQFVVSDLSVLDTIAYLPQDLSGCVNNLKNVAYVNESAMRHALINMFEKVLMSSRSQESAAALTCYEGESTYTAEQLTQIMDYIVEVSDTSVLGMVPENIGLQAALGCDACSISLKGESYGFYPFWLGSSASKAAGMSSNPAFIDFRSYSRLGYFALPISSEGNITKKFHWQKDDIKVRQFVKQLTRYNIKRDIVLFSNSWDFWEKPEEYAATHLNYIRELNALVEAEGGISGITLYFENYTKDSDVTNILDYLHTLIYQNFDDHVADGSPLLDVNVILGVDWNLSSRTYIAEEINAFEPQHSQAHLNSRPVIQSCESRLVNKNDEDQTYFKDLSLVLVGHEPNYGESADYEVTDFVEESTSASSTDPLRSYRKLKAKKMRIENGIKRATRMKFRSNPKARARKLSKMKSDGGSKVTYDNRLVIDNLMVFLHESTLESKQCLRHQIEGEFFGLDRELVRNKVVPILGRSKLPEQKEPYKDYVDNLAYLTGNYGGLGFWPLQINKDENSISREAMLLNNFLHFEQISHKSFFTNYADLGLLGSLLNTPTIKNDSVKDHYSELEELTTFSRIKRSICEFVCPRSLEFEYLMAAFAFIWVATYVGFRTNCTVRTFLKRIKWVDTIIKLLTIILFIGLLACDPYWQSKSDTIILGFSLFAIAYFLYRRYVNGHQNSDI